MIIGGGSLFTCFVSTLFTYSDSTHFTREVRRRNRPCPTSTGPPSNSPDMHHHPNIKLEVNWNSPGLRWIPPLLQLQRYIKCVIRTTPPFHQSKKTNHNPHPFRSYTLWSNTTNTQSTESTSLKWPVLIKVYGTLKEREGFGTDQGQDTLTTKTIKWTKWGSPLIPFGRGDLHITHPELFWVFRV